MRVGGVPAAIPVRAKEIRARGRGLFTSRPLLEQKTYRDGGLESRRLMQSRFRVKSYMITAKRRKS
jgi:hypothetical protein